LNDGSDEEAASEGRTVKKIRLNLPMEDSEPITSNDVEIRLIHDSDTPTGSPVADARDAGSPQRALSVADLSHTHGLADRSSTQVKSHNLLLWSYFNVSSLPGKCGVQREARGKGELVEDRQIQCKLCNWKTTDSARATSTSNMKLHLNKHGIHGDGSGGNEVKMRQESV
ncbi:hypothetical protein V1505DRAFT_292181, partial [Lipomyces doorenjongii]